MQVAVIAHSHSPLILNRLMWFRCHEPANSFNLTHCRVGSISVICIHFDDPTVSTQVPTLNKLLNLGKVIIMHSPKSAYALNLL